LELLCLLILSLVRIVVNTQFMRETYPSSSKKVKQSRACLLSRTLIDLTIA
jgi:hypothetical protein